MSAAFSTVPTTIAVPPSLPPGAAAFGSDRDRPGTSGAVLSSLQSPGTLTAAPEDAAEPVSAPVSAAFSPPPPEPPIMKPSRSAMTAPGGDRDRERLARGFSPSRAGFAAGAGLTGLGLAAFGSFGLRSFFGLAFGSGLGSRSASGMTVAFGSYS